MIGLDIQFKLVIFSFFYGFLFSSFLDWFNNKTVKLKSYVKFIMYLIVIIFLTFIYFTGIQKIGYAIFHIYEILCIIIGFVSYDIILKLIAK